MDRKNKNKFHKGICLPKIRQRAVKVDAGKDAVISHMVKKQSGTTKAPIIAHP